MKTKDCQRLISEIIESYRANPVDLLDIGDVEGEYRYLCDARRSYERTIRDILPLAGVRTECGSTNPFRVLEIGAYLGPVSIALAREGLSVTAADIPQYMQNQKLREKYRQSGVTCLSFNLGDYEIPAPAQSFDLVVMCETLEHLNFNPLPVLREIHRVLADRGYLYLSLPNLASLVNRVKLMSGHSIHNSISDFSAQLKDDDNMIVGIHWREYTGGELREILDLTGFQIERHYYFTNTESHPLARVVYKLFPGLRPNQTVLARMRP